MLLIIPTFTASFWHLADLLDSVKIEIFPHKLNAIPLVHFSLPITTEEFELIIQKLRFNPLNFKHFTIHDNKITCTIEFYGVEQNLVLYKFPQISTTLLNSKEYRLKLSTFSYDICTNNIYLLLPQFNLKFEWNPSYEGFCLEGKYNAHFLSQRKQIQQQPQQ